MPYFHGKPSVGWSDGGPVQTQVSLGATSWIGVSFDILLPGRLFGLAFYFAAGDTPPRWGLVWDFTHGVLIAARQFPQFAQTVTGWRRLWLHPVHRFTVGTNYRVAVLKSSNYWRTSAQLAGAGLTINDIHYQNSFQSTALDPTTTAIGTNTNANGVDVLVQLD